MSEASEREELEFDVVIVGGGPSGLAAALRLSQLAAEAGEERSICVLEKGSEIGAHIISGAAVEPRALDELLPDWRQRGVPLKLEAGEEALYYLTAKRRLRLPTPPQMHNAGNLLGSLGTLCRWLAEQAEAAGVEVFPGFPAAEVLYDEAGAVCGVATPDMGRHADGSAGANFEPGVALRAKQTIFAEGAHGSLTKGLIERFDLRRDAHPQTYGLGLKELWEIPAELHRPGRTVHTIGWPLDQATYGGGFIYHMEERQLALGLVVGLDYDNPYLSPYKEFQRWKTHAAVRPLLEGGRRLAYGARVLPEGGWQSVPRLSFPGGVLAGDTAGFVNVPKIKGIHTALKSGMLAAEAVDSALRSGQSEAGELQSRLAASWVGPELKRVRNIRPAFRWGLVSALGYSALETYLLRGRAPWTLRNQPDYQQLKPAAECSPIAYPKPDGRVTFDRLSSVFMTNTQHAEDQPCHLLLRDPQLPSRVNWPIYAGPEARYCPAGVYAYETDESGSGAHLRIDSINCIHCKACDIKDPAQNITWSVPQGGDGPNYPNL